MIDEGQTLDVDISDVAYRGVGIARHEGFVILIPGVLPGERVRVEVTRRRKRHGEARVVEILSPSPHRVEPACALAGTCPGCTYQHADYAEELRLKQAQLVSCLTRQAHVDPTVIAPPIASPSSLGYRNKIIMHGATGPDGSTVLGYVGADNATVFDVPNCPLAMPALQVLLARLRADGAFMADARTQRTVTLRATAADGPRNWSGKPSAAAPLTEQTPIGPLAVPRGAFFQVNSGAGALLIETVRAWLRELQPQALVDLFCGVGVFALAAAQDGVRTVRGADSDAAAIDAARQNAKALGASAALFACASAAESVRPALQGLDPAQTVLLVDPPRTGLSADLIADVATATPAHLLYVSCAADTLARDLVPLAAAGYRVRRAQLVDMFPRTPYFESVVLLRKESEPPLGAASRST